MKYSIRRKISKIDIIIFILFFSSSLIFAQNSVLSLTEGNKWIYRFNGYEFDSPNDPGSSWNGVQLKEIIGDTLIDNKSCKIVFITSISDTNYSFAREYWYADQTIFLVYSYGQYEYNRDKLYLAEYYNSIYSIDTCFGSGGMGWTSICYTNYLDILFDNLWNVQNYSSESGLSGRINKRNFVFAINLGLFNTLVHSYGDMSTYFSETILIGGNIDNYNFGQPHPPLNFSYEFDPNEIILKWSTTNTIEIAGYNIYRKTDQNGNELITQINSPDIDHYKLDLNIHNNQRFTITAITTTGIESIPSPAIHINYIPQEVVLQQNYPNPFNNSTTITYSTPTNQNMQLAVYDILGRKVKTIFNKYFERGNYKFEFIANVFSSGIYFLRLNSSNNSIIKKMVILK